MSSLHLRRQRQQRLDILIDKPPQNGWMMPSLKAILQEEGDIPECRFPARGDSKSQSIAFTASPITTTPSSRSQTTPEKLSLGNLAENVRLRVLVVPHMKQGTNLRFGFLV